MKLHTAVKRALTWFLALSHREKLMVGAAAVVLVVYGASLPVAALHEELNDNERIVDQRRGQLRQLESSLQRYLQLEKRLQKLQTTFNRSQMSYEQVTQEIDSIVKRSIGKDDYELKRLHDPTPFGEEFNRQDFTLRIRNASLEQVVALLFNIEQGQNPLFVGKVDIAAAGGDTGSFSVVLDLSSISKSQR